MISAGRMSCISAVFWTSKLGEQERGIFRGRHLPRLLFLVVLAVWVRSNLALVVAGGREEGTGWEWNDGVGVGRGREIGGASD